jgi:hypothetical protein
MEQDYAILLLQVLVMEKYMEKHHITSKQYVELDEKYHLHQFVEDSIDYLNELGIDGILLEVEDYMAELDG